VGTTSNSGSGSSRFLDFPFRNKFRLVPGNFRSEHIILVALCLFATTDVLDLASVFDSIQVFGSKDMDVLGIED
jgi:hypothetical protein